jgi:Replication initiation factor
MREDWYTATVDKPFALVVGALESFFPYVNTEEARPLLRYQFACDGKFGDDRMFRVDGQEIGHTMITASSDTTPMVVKAVRELWPRHRVARVDVCEDYVGDGAFESMDDLLVAVAVEKGLRLDQAGDWLRKNGRTRYVGSRKSTTMVRLYEKGWEQYHHHKARGTAPPDDFDITRTRFETQLRPPSADKEAVATYTPSQVVAYSEWTRHANALMTGFQFAVPARAVKSRSPHERKMANLAKQYALTLTKQLELCDGSYELLGQSLMDVVREVADASDACKRIMKAKI